MIAAVIRWSARNVFLVGFATVFVTLAGIYAVSRVPLDAIPDLSDVQVIVYTEYPGQAPQVVEDQVTYPLTTAMLSVPKSRVVRGFSFFGVSFVYVIFEDGTDLYWARSRVLEYLNSAARRLPSGVTPSLGPDATGVGWVYQYVVRGEQKSLAELRTIQDWYVRYGIAKAEGVAEVASVGGFVKQYSVVIDPRRLQALGIPLAKIREALRSSNMDVGGRTVELAETEFAVRGRGYIKGLSDLEQIVVKSDRGVPVLLKDVARIELTPDERRGITEMNGEGEVVSGIALQRFGENALSVIRNVKDRLAEIAPSLPQGVTIESVYDRSDLIYRAIDTLKRTLIEESADRRARLRRLPPACPQCAGRRHHAAARRADRLSLHVPAGLELQHHEPRRHRHRHRRDGRRRDRHDRERAQAPGTRAARQAEVGGADRGRRRGRTRALLQPVDHHGVVPADLRARSAGRPPVQAARLHQDLCHGGGGAAVGDARPRPHDPVRARPHHAGAQESAKSVPHLDLPAGDPPGAALQGRHDPLRRGDPRRQSLAGDAARHRVHAQPQRGHAVLHADHASRPVRHQGRGAGADAGQDHQVVPAKSTRSGARRGARRRRPTRRRPRCSRP